MTAESLMRHGQYRTGILDGPLARSTACSQRRAACATTAATRPRDGLTSNQGVEEWGATLMAAAMIHRVLHHDHLMNIGGNG